jgi:hypothetical protein
MAAPKTRWPELVAEDLDSAVLRIKSDRMDVTMVVCIPLNNAPPSPAPQGVVRVVLYYAIDEQGSRYVCDEPPPTIG